MRSVSHADVKQADEGTVQEVALAEAVLGIAHDEVALSIDFLAKANTCRPSQPPKKIRSRSEFFTGDAIRQSAP